MAWHTQACADFSYWAVGSGKHRFQIKREQIGMHPVQECRSCNLPPVINSLDRASSSSSFVGPYSLGQAGSGWKW